MNLRVGFASDKGRVRENNEDSLLVLDLTWIFQQEHSHIGLYLVSDGIGGEAAGEVASRLTVTTVAREIMEHLAARHLGRNGNPQPGIANIDSCGPGPLGDQDDHLGALRAAVESANRMVRSWAEDHPENFGMGATVTGVLLLDRHAIICHVGDSRCYLLDAAVMEQVTEDHTLAGRMQRGGDMTAAAASRHPLRNVLYRSVGSDEEFRVDAIEQDLKSGNRLLLCSDGLTSMIADAEIERVVRSHDHPQIAVEELIHCANRAGGQDNITAVLVEL